MRLNKNLMKYEITNYARNMFNICYSFALPLGLALLFALITNSADPTSTNTLLLIMFTTLVPMATMFGHAGNYSSELENGSIGRFKLFGYSEKTLLLSKMFTTLIFITLSFVIYFAVMFIALPIAAPTAGAFITLIVFLYLFSAIFFILVHGIATLCGNYSMTYGLTLLLLMAFMGFSGFFGASTENMPHFMQVIGNAFPTFHITNDFLDFWMGGSFNFLGLILSTLGMAVFSVGVFALGVWVNKRRVMGNKTTSRFAKVLAKVLLLKPRT